MQIAVKRGDLLVDKITYLGLFLFLVEEARECINRLQIIVP